MTRDETLARYSTATLKKAESLDRGQVRPHESDPTIWWVTSPRTGKAQRVQLIEGFVMCDCSHGRHSGGHSRCYHSAAVYLLNKEKTQ